MDFSGILSSLMKDTNTTDKELAEAVGVSRAAVAKWRNGTKPSVDKMLKVAAYFDLKLEDFGIPSQYDSPETFVPILGRIQAGYPVESFDAPEGYVNYPVGTRRDNELIALRVVGDSMMPLVMEGDIVILDTETENYNGKICAVMVDNESTLKRVKLDSDGITLIPTNPMYKEIHFSPRKAEEKNIHIIGVLVQMIRNF